MKQFGQGLENRWGQLVAALMGVRLVMIALMFVDVPKLDYHVGWAFYHGGDEHAYFEIAQNILKGKFELTTISGAWAMVVAGAAYLTQAIDYEDTLPILVTFNGIIFSVTSVWLMAYCTWLFTNHKWQSIVAAGLWTLMPYLLWVAFLFFPATIALQNVFVPRQLWLNGLTDAPSMFLTLCGLALTLWTYAMRRTWWGWLLAGVCFGLAISVRIHSLATIAPVIAALVWARDRRAVAWLVAGMLIGFAPQAFYNAEVGSMWDTPYIRNWLRPEMGGGIHFEWYNTPFSPRFLLNNLITLASKRWVITLGGVVAAVAAVYAGGRAWQRRGSVLTIILFLMPLSTLGLYMTTYMFLEDPLRFTLPALTIGLPAITWTLFEAGCLLLSFWQKGNRTA